MWSLANLFGSVSQFEEDLTEVHADATLAELQMSHGDLSNLLRTALKAQHPGPDIYCWVRDVFDAEVIYELSNKDDATRLYQRSYSVDDAGVVTLGEPVSVVAVTSYVAATESDGSTTDGDPLDEALPGIVAWMRKHGGAHPHSACVAKFGDAAMCAKAKDMMTGTTKWRGKSKEAAEPAEITGELVPLVESAVKEDGTASIRIIAPGQGSSGFYPADVLKRDGPNVFTAGLQMYMDHPSTTEESSRPERSVKDLAGSLTGPAVWQEDGLYAPVKFIDSVAPHINAIAAISGMSIRASGKAGTREIGGQKVRTIESIDKAYSVDVVTVPGAGGKVVELMESLRSGKPIGKTEEEQQMEKELTEARAQIADLTRWKEAQEAREREIRLLAEARTVIVATLATIAMPTPTRDRLTESLSVSPPIKDDLSLDVDALKANVTKVAAAEVAYLASVNGGNPVRGMGGTEIAAPTTPTLEESGKRIDSAIAALSA